MAVSVTENRQTRGERTREGIVTAATERFSAQGFDATTLADVAADAGVSGPSVAFHFGNKDGLLAAVIERRFELLMAAIAEVTAAAADPAGRLRAFMRYWVRSHEGAFELYSAFATQGGWRQIESESGRALRDGYRQVNAVVDRLLDDMKAQGEVREEVSTRLVRDSLLGSSEWVMRGRLHTSRRPNYDRVADEILEVVISGAGTAPAAATKNGDRLAAIETKLDRLINEKDR
jgi:TetR/AcrR family transcriptional regulator, fatty acid metabolism regulator protein